MFGLLGFQHSTLHVSSIVWGFYYNWAHGYCYDNRFRAELLAAVGFGVSVVDHIIISPSCTVLISSGLIVTVGL